MKLISLVLVLFLVGCSAESMCARQGGEMVPFTIGNPDIVAVSGYRCTK